MHLTHQGSLLNPSTTLHVLSILTGELEGLGLRRDIALCMSDSSTPAADPVFVLDFGAELRAAAAEKMMEAAARELVCVLHLLLKKVKEPRGQRQGSKAR
eukprot:3024262-Rhodomonas_salina.4